MILRRRGVGVGPNSVPVSLLLFLQLAAVTQVGTEQADEAVDLLGDDFLPLELAASDFDAVVRSSRHTDSAIALFHWDESSAKTQFATMATTLTPGALQCYTVDCAKSPGFCQSQNARTPAVFVFPPGGAGPIRVVDEPFDSSGKLRESAIVKQAATIIAKADRSLALTTENIDSFMLDPLKPFKVVVYMGQKGAPPLSMQAVSANPQLTHYVDFGYARESSGGYIAESLGIVGMEAPLVVWMHGEDYSAHTYFQGNIDSPVELRNWVYECLSKKGGLADVDPGFPEFDIVDQSLSREIELLVRSETQDFETRVSVLRTATFRQAKRAIAKRLGNDQVFSVGKLAVRDGDNLVVHKDQDKVGDVREVILVGVELAAYEKMEYGQDGCPPGREITAADECERAIKSLGMSTSPKWVSNFDGLPRHCSVREKTNKESKERMHFNSASSGSGRPDLAPVCKVGKQVAAPAAQQRSPKVPKLMRREAAAAPPADDVEIDMLGLLEMTQANQDKLLPNSNGMTLLYFRSGPLTAAETNMLNALFERFRPMFKEHHIPLAWAWLDVSKEPKMKAFFAPPTLPSAGVLKFTGRGSRFSMLKHDYVAGEDGEASEDLEPLPADETAIAALVSSVLDGDARFKNLDRDKLTQSWAITSAVSDASSAKTRRTGDVTIVVKQPPPRGGQIRLVLQKQVTASEVKEALISRTGNEDIRENGVLTVMQGEHYVALEDTEVLLPDKGRQFHLLGAHLFLYKKLKAGSQGCAAGQEVKSVQECEAAITSLGMTAAPKWVSSYDGVPQWCSIREKPSKDSGVERMHFNAGAHGQGRKDLTPICKAGDDPPPDASRALSRADLEALLEATAAEAEASVDESAEVSDSPVPQLVGRNRKELLESPGFKVIYLREGMIMEEEEQMLVALAERFSKVSDSQETPLQWMWLDLRAERRLKGVFDPPALPSAVALYMEKGKPRYTVMEHHEFEDDALPADEESLAQFINKVLGGDAQFNPMPSVKLNTGWSDKAR